MDLKQYIKTLGVLDGQSYRGDCPSCGGSNTFTVAISSGSCVWNCFRANCKVAGGNDITASLASIRKRLSSRTASDNILYDVPDYFCSPLSNKEAIEYLHKYNCLEAYKDGRVHIKYDPRQHRVVFLTMKDGVCYGGTGRALNFRNSPKWYIYNDNCISPFICPSNLDKLAVGSVVTVVEDCTSATAISGVCDGISLQGTSILTAYIPLIAKYPLVKIALDMDASRKSLEIQRLLSYYTTTEVILLARDLKYEKPEDIKRILRC